MEPPIRHGHSVTPVSSAATDTNVLTGAPALSTGANTNSPIGNYTITVTQGTLGSTNYVFQFVSGTLTVNPAALTVTASNRVKTYGQTVTFTGTEFAGSNLLNADAVSSVTLSSSGAAATAGVPGSPYAINAINAIGTGLGNYNITYQPGILTVNPAALTVIAESTNKTYGQTVTFTGTEFASSNLLNADAVSSVILSSSGAAATAGVPGSPYAINAINAIGTGLGNYNITYQPGILTVNPAALTVIAESTNKTYGQTVTFTGTEFASSNLLNADAVSSVILSSSGAAATAGVPGSPYAINAINAIGTGLGNYNITYQPGILTVNPAALTVIAESTNKTYGQTVTFTGTEFASSNLLNADAVSSVTLSSSGAAATAGVPGSPYAINAINATGTGLGNYNITYQPGILTVNPAALTVIAESTNKTYGQTVTFTGTEFASSNLLNADAVSSVHLEQQRCGGNGRSGRFALRHQCHQRRRHGSDQLHDSVSAGNIDCEPRAVDGDSRRPDAHVQPDQSAVDGQLRRVRR